MSKKAEIISALKKAFGIGILLEVGCISAGYYFYLRYKADEGNYYFCWGEKSIEHSMEFDLLLFFYRIS